MSNIATTTATFWNANKGEDCKAAAALLQELIPAAGSVPQPRKNRALEDYRRLAGVYYEVYNNGGVNWNSTYSSALKSLSGRYMDGVELSKSCVCSRYGSPIAERQVEQLELLAEAVFVAACEEQGLGKVVFRSISEQI